MRHAWNIQLFGRGDWRQKAALILLGLLALPIAFLIVTIVLLGGLMVGLVMLAGMGIGALLGPRRRTAKHTVKVIDADYTVVAEGERAERNPWAHRQN